MGKKFDPEKHGMVVCLHCKERVKLLKDPDCIKAVCQKCDGWSGQDEV
jgi:hypothetical protein